MVLASNKKEETRRELIRPGNGVPTPLRDGILLREFVSEACAARGFSTGTATISPAAVLPYHTHAFSEAITLLSGLAQVAVEGRCYQLTLFDCLHVPAGVAHEVTNCSGESHAVALWAFASAVPSRELVKEDFVVLDRGFANPKPSDPESIVRFTSAEVYELSPGAHFRDLFAGRFGTVGVCGGYGFTSAMNRSQLLKEGRLARCRAIDINSAGATQLSCPKAYRIVSSINRTTPWR